MKRGIDTMIKSQIRQFCMGAIFLAISTQSCASPDSQALPSLQSASTQTTVPAATEIHTTATAIPTPSAPSFFFGYCWPIKPLEKGSGIKGHILFWSFENQAYFVWDVNSFHARKLEYGTLSPNDLSGYSISHDGSLLTAIFQSDSSLKKEDKIVLISPTQTKEYPIPQLLEGQFYRRVWFLPNGKIAINIAYSEEYRDISLLPESVYSPKTGYAYVYYVLDPATGSLTHNSILLKQFLFGSRINRVPIEFSPDMEYVMFKTFSYPDGEDKFALMNAKTSEVIWTGPYMPTWKPDGSALTSLGDNLYVMSKDGKIIQLTRFLENQSFAGFGPLYNEIPWSPDGHYVAFQTSGLPANILYIWDNEEKKVYSPCLPDELRAYANQRDAEWSMDSKYLFTGLVYPDALPDPNSDRNPPTHSSQFILDVENKIIYTLPDENHRGQYGLYATKGASIAGWLNWEVP